MDYRLSIVRVFVTDWDKAVAFYSDKLGMTLVFKDEANGWAQFDTGACDLAVERVDASDDRAAKLVGRFSGASLQVADIDAAYHKLSDRGVVFDGPPSRQPWGGRLAQLSDLEKNVLTLWEASKE